MSSKSPSLLQDVIAAHGGLERWASVRKITVTWYFHGQMLELKGYPGVRTPTVTVEPHAPANAVITNLDGDPTHTWHFSARHVEIRDAQGKVLQSRDDPRAAFADHKPFPPTPWDQLDLLYFVGYAMYNYFVTPFAFGSDGFATRELPPYTAAERAETWRVLEVTYPDGWPAHSKVQRYYFGSEDLLIRRLDYTADVVKGTGAHYCMDLRSYDGIVVPTHRRVVRRVEAKDQEPEDKAGDDQFLRDRPVLSAMSAFALTYTEVSIEDADGSVVTDSTFAPVQAG